MSRAAVPSSSLVAAFTRRGATQRQHMKVWGNRVAQRLRGLGLDVDRCHPGDDGVDFEPDGRLALTLTREHIEVALTVPLGELARATARLGEPVRALALTVAIGALPEQFELGVSGDARPVPASTASADDLRALFERAAREQRCVWLGWIVPRTIAVAHAALLDEQLEDALVALGSVLSLLGRTPVGTDAPEPRRERRDHPRPDEDSRSTRRRVRARSRDREAEPEREVESAAEPAAEREPVAPRSIRPLLARTPLRAGIRRPAMVAIDKGARVRVLEGPFAGKVGVVQELDGRGGARVMLGLLAVRIDVKDLGGLDEGRGRLRLGSSHRKPVPVRS